MAVSIKGKDAEFLLNQSGKATILRARSAEHIGYSYLFLKKENLKSRKTKYRCKNCKYLKDTVGTGSKIASLHLDHQNRYCSEADEGHDQLCEPIADVNVGANELKRKAYSDMKAGVGAKRVKIAHDRTTNAAEGWHSSLGRSLIMRSHPTLDSFLEWLQVRHKANLVRICQLVNGKEPKPRLKKYPLNDERLAAYRDSFNAVLGVSLRYFINKKFTKMQKI